jgi:hypothetical protein
MTSNATRYGKDYVPFGEGKVWQERVGIIYPSFEEAVKEAKKMARQGYIVATVWQHAATRTFRVWPKTLCVGDFSLTMDLWVNGYYKEIEVLP